MLKAAVESCAAQMMLHLWQGMMGTLALTAATLRCQLMMKGHWLARLSSLWLNTVCSYQARLALLAVTHRRRLRQGCVGFLLNVLRACSPL